MKKITFIILMVFASHCYTFAQVGIGTTTPHNSTILDIESTNKGVLVPRLTTAQRIAITTPATGLLIFNTTTNRFEYNSGTPAVPIWSVIATNPIVSSDANNLISAGTDSGT